MSPRTRSDTCFSASVRTSLKWPNRYAARPLTLTVHTLFGPIALVLGLVDLLPAMRQRRRCAVHRWLGRIYLVSALALGGAGLSLALNAAGGPVARFGFGLLAVATLATALQGYRHIRSRNVRQHREWMLRSYGLIFGAVTLRISASDPDRRLPGTIPSGVPLGRVAQLGSEPAVHRVGDPPRMAPGIRASRSVPSRSVDAILSAAAGDELTRG